VIFIQLLGEGIKQCTVFLPVCASSLGQLTDVHLALGAPESNPHVRKLMILSTYSWEICLPLLISRPSLICYTQYNTYHTTPFEKGLRAHGEAPQIPITYRAYIDPGTVLIMLMLKMLATLVPKLKLKPSSKLAVTLKRSNLLLISKTHLPAHLLWSRHVGHTAKRNIRSYTWRSKNRIKDL
jgi:hypothetical protein